MTEDNRQPSEMGVAFQRAEREREALGSERRVGDVFRDPDTGILVRVVSIDPYQIDPIFMWTKSKAEISAHLRDAIKRGEQQLSEGGGTPLDDLEQAPHD